MNNLTITFLRGGEVLDARPATDGAHAVKVALLMLAHLDQLQGGDQLRVVESPPADLPAVSRSSHYS
jgi:hypothetical protein